MRSLPQRRPTLQPEAPEAQRRRRPSPRYPIGRALIVLVAAMGLVAPTAVGCGQENGLVGGDCAPGLTQCDLTCVDLQTDNQNCGACGNVCPAGKQCAGGVCGGPIGDATADGHNDGAGDDGADLDGTSQYCDVLDENQSHCHPLDGGGDGNVGDGNTGDGNIADGANDGNGDASYPDGCTPPFNTAGSCGSCGRACVSPNPLCALVNGSYDCVPLCAPPLTDCGGHCVNLLRDPQNCGACNNICPSNYCLLATCQGTVAGNVVVIGHDFRTTQTTDQQAKLLTNSVFYNNTTSVRLLSFEGYSSPAAVTNAKTLINTYAAQHNVTLTTKIVINDTDVPSGTLVATSYDVFLVYDQSNAPPGKLGALGTSWAPAMSQFTQQGGIVIVLDGGQGLVAEMPQFATNGALLAVTSHTSVASGTPVNITSPATVARGMTSVYLLDDDSMRFTTSEPAGSKLFYVATEPTSGELLVVHKIVD